MRVAPRSPISWRCLPGPLRGARAFAGLAVPVAPTRNIRTRSERGFEPFVARVASGGGIEESRAGRVRSPRSDVARHRAAHLAPGDDARLAAVSVSCRCSRLRRPRRSRRAHPRNSSQIRARRFEPVVAGFVWARAGAHAGGVKAQRAGGRSRGVVRGTRPSSRSALQRGAVVDLGPGHDAGLAAVASCSALARPEARLRRPRRGHRARSRNSSRSSLASRVPSGAARRGGLENALTQIAVAICWRSIRGQSRGADASRSSLETRGECCRSRRIVTGATIEPPAACAARGRVRIGSPLRHRLGPNTARGSKRTRRSLQDESPGRG
jgi:hypothetical protein